MKTHKVDVVSGYTYPNDKNVLWFDESENTLKKFDGEQWVASNNTNNNTSSGLPMMRQPTQEDLEWLLNSELYSQLLSLYGHGCTLDLMLTPASSVFTMPDGKIIMFGDTNDDGSYTADTEVLTEFYDKLDFNRDQPFLLFTKSDGGELVYTKITTIKST